MRAGGRYRADMEREDHPLWFGKRDGGLPFGPLTWQGRAAIFLYCALVLLAVITYSQLALTAFVIVFYTVAFVLLVAYKSDLLDNWPPGS
jgi:dolichol kinase